MDEQFPALHTRSITPDYLTGALHTRALNWADPVFARRDLNPDLWHGTGDFIVSFAVRILRLYIWRKHRGASTLKTLKIVLQRIGDPNVLPFIHVILLAFIQIILVFIDACWLINFSLVIFAVVVNSDGGRVGNVFPPLHTVSVLAFIWKCN